MTLILYLVQVTCCLAFFYMFFHFLLQKETLFETNRLYLITSLVLSITLPLLKIYVDSQSAESAIAPYVFIGAYLETITLDSSITKTKPFPWYRMIIGLYSIGIAFMAIRFLNAVKEIFQIKRSGQQTYLAGTMYILSDKVKSPFSFFNTIYIPNNHAFEEAELEEVITHEMAHVQRRHTLDVLFMEVACIFLWPSPLIYFYKKALRDVHEYAADAAVLKDTPWENYAQLLLGQQQGQLQNVLSNQLIYSQLKKRLVMMNKERSGSIARFKYLGVIPIFLVALVLFSFRERMSTKADYVDPGVEPMSERILLLTIRANQKIYFGLKEVTKENLESVLREQLEITNDTLLLVKLEDGGITVNDIAEIDVIGQKLKIRTVFQKGIDVECGQDGSARSTTEFDRKLPVFPGCANVTAEKQVECGATKMIEYIKQNMSYPESVRKAGIEGNVVVKFTVGADGLVNNIEVVKSLHPDADQAVVTLVSDMNVKVGKWLPATKQGKNHPAEMHLPVNFALDDSPTKEEPMMYAEELPRFPGCENILDEEERSTCSTRKLYEFIYNNINYPQQDRDNKIEGHCIVQFGIGADGSIFDIDVIRSPSDAMKEEVIRMMNVMASMPAKWTPARQDGKAVAMRFTLPVKFKLQEEVIEKESPATESPAPIPNARTIQVVPNPATETITLELIEGAHSINIFNVAGKLVLSQKVNEKDSRNETINVSSLPAGPYVVQLMSTTGHASGGFSIVK